MKYKNMVEGIFISRPNRFIAHVMVDGQPVVAHVKNTGRCKELLIQGVEVILRKEDNLKRKTPYSLISVYKNGMLINMDSQIPNYVVDEGLRNGLIKGVVPSGIKREFTYKASRFDIKFHNEISGKTAFMEVKGVTLEVDGLAKFPDAPTPRGVKHMNHLIEAVGEGYEAFIFFLIQIEGIRQFTPNAATAPEFAKTLKRAKESGVNILCYNSIVTFDSIEIGEAVEIII